MLANKVSIKAAHISTTDADNDWTLSIQTEDYTITQAKFPNLSNYVVLVDGEAIVGHDTLARIFSMSPYNFYECVLWKVGDVLTVDSIVVKNSLLDNDVVHHIGVVPRL